MVKGGAFHRSLYSFIVLSNLFLAHSYFLSLSVLICTHRCWKSIDIIDLQLQFWIVNLNSNTKKTVPAGICDNSIIALGDFYRIFFIKLSSRQLIFFNGTKDWSRQFTSPTYVDRYMILLLYAYEGISLFSAAPPQCCLFCFGFSLRLVNHYNHWRLFGDYSISHFVRCHRQVPTKYISLYYIP